MLPVLISNVFNMYSFFSSDTALIPVTFLHGGVILLYAYLYIYLILLSPRKYHLNIDSSDDSDSDGDSDYTTDDEDKNVVDTTANTKFNKDYEHKYKEQLETLKSTYTFEVTEEEKIMINKKVDELMKEERNPKPSTEDIRSEAEGLVIGNRWLPLMNSYLFESTPLGNVLMRYNQNLEAFEFYSDNTIPYRFLETVSRKYIVLNNCLPLYVDMSEVLKESEEKMLLEESNKEKEKEANKENPKDEKRNVFAKLKQYNNSSFSTSMKNIPPSKNNIPGAKVPLETNKDKKMILKDKSNRYSYQGKMANFQMIKQVDKKITNKKYGISFADFKAQQLRK